MVTLATDFLPFLLHWALFNKTEDFLKSYFSSTPLFLYLSLLMRSCAAEAIGRVFTWHAEVSRFGSLHLHLIDKLEKVLKNNYQTVLYVLANSMVRYTIVVIMCLLKILRVQFAYLKESICCSSARVTFLDLSPSSQERDLCSERVPWKVNNPCAEIPYMLIYEIVNF